MVRIIIEDLNEYESKTMGTQLTPSQDEFSYVLGVAAGLEAWLERHVSVDHVNGVWYITIADEYQLDES
jgi:hypothetical protein